MPEFDWARTRRVWSRLEDMGLHHAWTFDHHSWRSLRDKSWYDPLTTLAAVSAVTSRMNIGTLAATPNFRHPAVLAKQAMTLDNISGGRLILGLGAGAAGDDARLLGAPPLSPRQHADRFAEFVGLLDRMLREKTTNHAGEYYTVVDAKMIPGCVQSPRVPFAVAASGRRGLRLAAEHGIYWVTMGDPRNPSPLSEADQWAMLRRQISELRAQCETVGREYARVAKLIHLSRIVNDPCASAERLRDLAGRCGELGFTDIVVHYPRESGVYSGDVRVFEAAVTEYLRHSPGASITSSQERGNASPSHVEKK